MSIIKSGHIQTIKLREEIINFVGIGRVGDRKKRTDKRFIQDYERKEIKKLLKYKECIDILITHDKDDSSQRGYGMTEIREVLDNVIFCYHFYGHTGEPFKQEVDINGITNSIKIKELEFNKDGVLPYGCMLILEKKKEGECILEIVEQRITNQLTKHNWKY